MSHKIYTYSIIHTAAEAFKDKVPYVIAIIESPEGTHTMAQIEGYHVNISISIGMEVNALTGDAAGRYCFN